jgi:hypothetical protein
MMIDPPVQTPARPIQSRRKFGLLDLMILIFATASSLAWVRATLRNNDGFTFIGSGPSRFFSSVLYARAWFSTIVMVLAPISFGCVVIRLRRPRPDMQEVTCQPGFVACLSASMVIALNLASKFGESACEMVLGPLSWPGMSITGNLGINDMGRLSATAGSVVLASWTLLILGRRWMREPGWIDRMGCIVGMAWVATVPIQIAFEFLWPLGMSGKI